MSPPVMMRSPFESIPSASLPELFIMVRVPPLICIYVSLLSSSAEDSAASVPLLPVSAAARISSVPANSGMASAPGTLPLMLLKSGICSREKSPDTVPPMPRPPMPPPGPPPIPNISPEPPLAFSPSSLGYIRVSPPSISIVTASIPS